MGEDGRSYLDHNATTPVRPEAMEAVARALRLPGNPASIHAEGRAARAALETARAEVARLVDADAAGVRFTSGGTEAANALLSGGLRRAGGPAPRRLLVGAGEHPCVAAGHGFPAEAVEVVPLDPAGRLRLDVLAARLETLRDTPLLISVQAANNETGVLQPLEAVVALARAHGGALVHSDAVQAVGRVVIAWGALDLDALSLSGHKLGAPKGTGAMVLGAGRVLERPLLRGGGQESRSRAGTENLPGIAGFGAAARGARAETADAAERLGALRDGLEAGVRAMAPEAVVFGAAAARLPNTACFAVPGLEAATALMALDLAGVAVSSGAACASGKAARSTTLAAMGVSPALAAGALRVSLGWNTRAADVDRFLAVFERVVSSLYRRRGAA